MGLLLLIIVLVLVFGGGGYYGHRSGWYGRRNYVDGPRTGGLSFGMFLLIALLLILLFGGIGGPYMGYWHY